MISYEEERIVYDDSELEVRPSPNDSEGYTLHIKNCKMYISFPRDTLEEIGLANRDEAKSLIDYLMPSYLWWEDVFGKNNLNYDSIIAALTKAHIKEEKRKSFL